MSDQAKTISKEEWQKKLAKIAEDGADTGSMFGWLGVPLLAGLALGFIAGLPLWGVGVGLGTIVLGLFRLPFTDGPNFYKWEEDKIENISYKKNKVQAYLTGFLLAAPVLSPLLWPISFVVKNTIKITEGAGIVAAGKDLFGNPVLAQEKQAAAAEKAAAKAAQKAKAEPAQLPAPAIAVAAPVIEAVANAPVRPARSTIGNNRVTVRLPGAAPGEGA